MTEWKKVSTYNWKVFRSGLVSFDYFSNCNLPKAETLGIYVMPELPMGELISLPIKNENFNYVDQDSDITYGFDYIQDKNEYWMIKGWAYLNSGSMDFKDISIWLIDGDEQIHYYPLFERRYDITFDKRKVGCGFLSIIEKKNIPNGEYSIYIEINDSWIFFSKKSLFKQTDKQLIVI